MSEVLDSNSEHFLRRSLLAGTAILFTGAGFSYSARNVVGGRPPLGKGLRTALWEVAYPSDEFDDQSDLGDLFDVAMRTAATKTVDLLRSLFSIDRASLPEMYKDYLSLPWYRIYTLNIDNLIDAAQRQFQLPHEISVLTGRRDELPAPDKLSAIHLNGRLDDLPDVTFSAPQYGERTANVDVIYPNFVREIASHPTVFIGTELNEPTLWHHVAKRGAKGPGRELRPKSFLVIPSMPAPRKALLGQYNVKHVPMDAEEFWEAFVAPAAKSARPRAKHPSPASNPYESVSEVRARPVESPADFLLGREPDWGDVQGSGFAVPRVFEETVLQDIESELPEAVFFTGTAGSGKSTSLRRAALHAEAGGMRVLWLRRSASQSVGQLLRAASDQKADVVAIDQAERFGRRGFELIGGLIDLKVRVLASFSSSSFDDLGVERQFGDHRVKTVVTPLLDDLDIHALLSALERARRLGRLASLTEEQRFREFKKRSHRQLLVAMLEATSGEKFEDKIARECTELNPELQLAYAATALATSNRYSLGTEDLLAIVSDVSTSGLSIIDRLERQHLLLPKESAHYVLRHPLVAQQVVSYYRNSGQLAEAIARLAFVMASKFYVNMPRTPQRRLLTSLISHEYLKQNFDGVIEVRELYQELEPLLDHEADYWLQRGSYELECGDMPLAENFLGQALSLSEKSTMVRTEWAYLMLKRACAAPNDDRSHERADEGVDILLDVIEKSGRTSPHTYVVLGRSVVDWCKRAPLQPSAKKDLLSIVRRTLRDGEKFHPGNRHFRAAVDEVERAYLGLAT